MDEDRTLENPKYFRAMTRPLAIGVAAGLATFFVPDGWSFWERMVPVFVAIFLGDLVVRALFWKFAGVPMGYWITAR